MVNEWHFPEHGRRERDRVLEQPDHRRERPGRRANNVTFADNTIIGDPTATTTTVDIIRNSTGVRINGNYIVRPATAPAGPVLRFSQNNSGFPSNAVIASNRLVQNTQAQAIHLEGVSRTIVSANNVTMAVPWSVG
jgi:hypothetical protein